MKPINEEHPLRRLFTGLVDNVFTAEVGVCDPALTSYLADLLVNFVRLDALFLRDVQGRPLEEVADMLAAARFGTDGVRGERDLLVYRHIGDYTLFWSGLYPEYLRRRPGLAFKDRLLDYIQEGKRSYAIASELADRDTDPSGALLNRLSQEFEICCHGLGLVRRGWEQADPDTGDQTGQLLY